ncbi:hypothetical protein [uncultured Duncaniella sp.]|uniref:hypothetical protein n=1 Tax=uncultured Duncaniella sp. TaxID=2768039 RepID=UPI0025DB7868|nr:hypothetical protein [uncultured Duncaniella sp.]
MSFFKSLAKGIGGVLSSAAGAIPVVGQYASKAVDGLVGSFTSASDARSSLRAQNELLQKQQQFAHDEAALNRQFQVDMFNKTNQYNSPTAQVDRLVSAGLNPQLAYGGSMSEASSPAGSQASSPGAPSVDGLSDLSLRAAEIARINAETSLIKSQTKKSDADTEGQLTFNKYQEQLLTGQIETNSMTIKLGNSTLSLNEAEKKKLYTEVKNLEKTFDILQVQIDEIKARTSNLNADTYSKRVHTFLDGQLAKAQLSEMASRTSLNYTQCKTLVQDILIRSRLADSQISLNDSQISVNDNTATGISLQNGRIELDLEIDKGGTTNPSFRAYERRMQAAGLVGKECYTFLQQFLELF